MLGVKVALLAVIGCLVIALVQAQNLDERMRWINNRLMESAHSEDVNVNFEAAARYLATLEKRARSLKNCIAPVNPDLIESVKKFLRLKKVMDGDECNYRTFDIINFDGATTERIRDYYKTGVLPTMRIQRVILEVDKKHAEICAKLYPDLLASKVDELPADFKDFVKLVAGVVVGEHEYAVREYIRILDLWIKTKEGAPREITRDDYINYLLTPCTDFDAKVGDELYAEVTGQKMACFNWNAREEYKTNCNNKLALKVCRHLIANKGHIWKGIAEIFKKVGEEADCQF